jgi:Excreted virulence factor EspC, type VII ESX diderm
MCGHATIRAVQVDADELRVAARVLRDDVAEGLRRAADRVRVPERQFGVEAAFDRHTTAAAYQQFTAAAEEEFRLLAQAAHDLAEALERTALDYERSDERAAHRLGGGRR